MSISVTYYIWVKADHVQTGAPTDGGETNYQLTMSRQRARELYAELKREFG
ncbi:hypothetical protein MINTMi27_14730 [Mycobacterium intracellulare]|nr:hypothetical protein MINTMi27_14730 [Mycobacterium intracellulare]